MTSETQWLEERKTGIGATDAPVILGISPWKGIYELWAEKCGLLERDDISAKEEVYWGRKLQEPIAEGYAERTGRLVEPWPQFQLARHPDLDWMLCTPDAIEFDPRHSDFRGDLEIKTASLRYASDWSDEPPLHYTVQLQHQLAITGHTWGTLCCLIGGQKLVWHDLERSDRFIAALLKAEEDFWDRVQHREPPPVDFAARHTAAVLAKLHPADSGETILLPDEASDWDRELSELAEQSRDIEALEEEAKNKLRHALGDATWGILPGGGRWQWKTQERKEYVVKASTIRVLRRVK